MYMGVWWIWTNVGMWKVILYDALMLQVLMFNFSGAGLMRFWLEDVAVDLNEIVQGTPRMETYAVS